MKNYFFTISKALLYAAPFCLVIVSSSTLFPFIVGKYTFFRTAVGLSLIFFLLGLGFGSYAGYAGNGVKVKDKFKSPLVIAMFIFVFIFTLASFFGVDPSFSFWSNFERGEGGFQLITLLSFFVLTTLLFNSEKDWQIFFSFWLVAAVLVIGYGVLAHLGQSGYKTFAEFMGPKISAQSRFQGSLGNPAYTAPYLLLSAIFAFYLFINSASKIKKGVLLALMAIFLVFFWLAQTRGTFLGLVAGGFMFFVYLIFAAKKGKWKFWLIGVLAILLAIGGTLYYFRNTKFVEQMPGGRLFQISLSDETAQTRLWTWGSAFKGFKDRPVLGWGPENFSAVFDKYFDTRHFVVGQRSETWFDRAHSVYFDYLSETGVLGLLSYLAIFAVFYIQFFKWRFKNKSENNYKNLSVQGLIFAVPIAYLIQGIALFDILPIYLTIFAFLAFSNFIFNEKEKTQKNNYKF